MTHYFYFLWIGARGKVIPQQIKIKIKDIDYHLYKLKRRVLLSGWTDSYQNLRDKELLNSMISQLFQIPDTRQNFVKHSDLSSLLLAVNQMENSGPLDDNTSGQSLDILMQADLIPSGESFEFFAAPWASLSDIALTLASTIKLPVDQIENCLLNGMGELGERQFSLYPTTIELLRNELIRCEKCLLSQEMYILNQENNLGPQTQMHSNKQSSTFSLPYLKSMLGNPDEEFQKADEDGDGYISRAEWRKWMHDKETLIRVHNIDKAQLIKAILYFFIYFEIQNCIV